VIRSDQAVRAFAALNASQSLKDPLGVLASAVSQKTVPEQRKTAPIGAVSAGMLLISR